MVTQLLQSQNWDIVGHEHSIDILRRTLAAQQVRHAYLFVGPQRIGKHRLAQQFAQALLCTGGPDPHRSPTDPCHQCLSCRKIMHNNHPDVHVITKAVDKQFITIDQVRELQSSAARRTLEGRRNIFLLPDAQDMNVQAANCLLKTLEEPEPEVVLLLTVPDAGLLLPTILSRVQQIPMHLLTAAQIRTALLREWDVDEQQANLISSLAAGRMGWAVQAVEDEEMLDERRTLLESLAKLPGMSKVQRFDFVQQLGLDAEKARTLLELWLLWWRDLVLTANGCLELTVNVDLRDLLARHAAKIGSAEAERVVRAILQTQEAIDQNVNVRVAMEVLLMDLPLLKM
ncbi:DNA polymerase III subunit delta' [Tengunoibacter tsumagoiensis]|uniref:DNA polymerase III subunit delta' n=1 Tax=Tengunoibacter tsumagoiensis TaxID=2014871 RepID=A0A402A292_9CHLR|nr:DNA polymerase III subunit delta' [Tengunoibacter tsumagoiensis]GCE13263.1 DNA polymerase III subunit delta' [Tengunoibacter tsumagoiensis]